MSQSNDKHWYLIHTFSGHEDKVRSGIEKSAAIKGLNQHIAQVVIPTEEVIELKKNKKQIEISHNQPFRNKEIPPFLICLN